MGYMSNIILKRDCQYVSYLCRGTPTQHGKMNKTTTLFFLHFFFIKTLARALDIHIYKHIYRYKIAHCKTKSTLCISTHCIIF